VSSSWGADQTIYCVSYKRPFASLVFYFSKNNYTRKLGLFQLPCEKYGLPTRFSKEPNLVKAEK